MDFKLPNLLSRLIAKGVWPSASGPSLNEQQRCPTIREEYVKRFAEDERCICLYPPPFHTISSALKVNSTDNFYQRFGALDQIDPKRAVVIADFGIGADSVVVLDYARNSENPPVLRLKWGERGEGNTWVEGASDFQDFACQLGLA